ncbi:ABC-2 family transporter protein [Paenibacillus sp. HB172176]|uniref:ABC transporter permease n=1 Tax=Paenibacillus sp. HB172176 TaxID=2493690 RepID=UPI001439C838|nr:ABC-2 family transporter protein [Paenibacillus sp. HB172176]
MRTFSKHTFSEYLVLYLRFIAMTMKARMSYKLNTFLLSAAVLCRECVTVITLYLMLQKFSTINGWDISQLLFMYSFVFLSYSLCIVMFTGVREFETTVQQGEFDTYLTKPMNAFFQVISRKSDIMAAMAHGGLGLAMFIYAYSNAHIPVTLSSTFAIIAVIAGGILIQGALLLIPAAMTFWITKSREMQSLIFYQMRGFIAYPITIYPKVIQLLLTFVIPLAFVNYYPATYLFEDSKSPLLYLTPAVGLILFSLSLLLWRIGVTKYKSTGH